MQVPLVVILSVFIALLALDPAWGQSPDVPDRPNILWLVAEDMSPYLASFGDPTVSTPNLDRLAAEGVRYTNVFSVSGVCSPSRAALATGMYPTSIGAHHMRTTYQQPEAREMGIIDYEVVPPPHVRMVSEIMREHGYYTSNNSKEDYQFHPSMMAWDETSLFAHWRNRPEGKPFFSVFNFGVTHEGQIWNPATTWNLRYGRDVFPPDRNQELVWIPFPPGVEKELYIPSDLQVPVPPYLPDTPPVIKDIRRMYSNVVEMDRYVGVVLSQLEE
ncbi:MAG: sulfatase-like hydrolase/transferase, partial [Gemmatimonadetes bacterium]|nr:sulfatase-like hydrolase/transferase [Gemmatimonadota bacterium]